MTSLVAILLAQDALTNGAIYALLALTMVMVFSVTRVIFVPQGEIVSLAALTLASLENSTVPGTLWLLCIGGAVAAAVDLYAHWRSKGRSRSLRSAVIGFAYPAAVALLVWVTVPLGLGAWFRMILTLLIVAPLGLVTWRLAFRPLSHASVLVLLIVAMAVHVFLTGFGLLAFGAEGVRTAPVFAGMLHPGGFPVKAQGLFVVAVTIVMIVLMALFFGRTLLGKALQATAFNQTGARLVGIRPEAAGALAFFLAGLLGTLSGMLIAPLTTIYFDTGFLIGLKGFIAAIMGGLGSYPLAAAGAVLIGFVESYSSFWASAFKDALVFAMILPILLWRNVGGVATEEDEE